MADLITTFIAENTILWEYLILPFLIIAARLVDVSISTYRTIITIQGQRSLAAALGSIEALIWLIVIAAILQNVSSWVSYLAYAVGFGLGIYFGMWVEEKLAQGYVVIQLITRRHPEELLEWMRQKDFRFTLLEPESNEGKCFMIFMPVSRKQAELVIPTIRKHHPNGFYTISSLKSASQVPDFIGDDISPVGLHKFFAKRY